MPAPASASAPQNAPHRSSDRKSTRLNSSHQIISYAVFCLKKKNTSLNYSHQVIWYALFSYYPMTSSQHGATLSDHHQSRRGAANENPHVLQTLTRRAPADQ